MLHNAPTYIFAALSAIAATALATWQVGLVLANSTAAIDPASIGCPSDGKRYAAVDSLLLSSVYCDCWAPGVLPSLHLGFAAMQIVNHIQHYSSPIFQVGRVSTVQRMLCTVPCCLLHVAASGATLPTWRLCMQRYILRIIFMVPVYSVCSFLALVRPHDAVYFETVRVM